MALPDLHLETRPDCTVKPSAISPLPFTVIGGFLGAGKTTMLNQLLDNANGTRFAVLVNDFGELNIDERLITRHDGETIALANGCMCCSMADGFISALSAVMDRADQFDQLVVEASGVSNPRRIMDIATLDPGLIPNGSIVLVDASQLLDQLDDSLIEDAVVTQIKEADILVVNKTGLADSETLERVATVLTRINPDCPTVTSDRQSLTPEVLLGVSELQVERSTRQSAWEKTGGEAMPHSGDHAHGQFRSCVLRQEKSIDRSAFDSWAESLPPAVLRGKGFVVFSDTPDQHWLWQKVGRSSRLEPGKGDPVADSAVVLIGTSVMPIETDPSITGPFRLLTDRCLKPG